MKLLTFTKGVTRRISQTKKALKLSRDEPKKASPGLIDDPNQDEQRPKKASRSSDRKIALQGQEKKLKRPHRLKKHQSHLNYHYYLLLLLLLLLFLLFSSEKGFFLSHIDRNRLFRPLTYKFYKT